MKYYLAIDLGASSGRHIVGYFKDEQLILEEIYRFKDYLIEKDGHLIWDIERILLEVKIGIKLTLAKYPRIESMSIDTWGCDYVLMNNDKEILPCYAYRDSRTLDDIDNVHKIISFKKLYKISGSQFQPFNTLYQLFDDKAHDRLDTATDFLMIPEYLAFKLTGNKIKEYTNASTTGMMDLKSPNYSKEIISKLGFKKELFKELHKSGYEVGHFLPSIKKELGGDIKVVLSSSHDTASAVKGIDIPNNTPYLSSGTWSLLGVKVNEPINSDTAREANYSNEFGDYYIRFQKNIMGMWIVNNLANDLRHSHPEMIKLAKRSKYQELFDVNDKRFLATLNIRNDMDSWFKEHNKPLPTSQIDYINSVYHSLAYSYKVAIDELEQITNQTYDCLYIVGGGAKNTYLNELTEKYTNKRIIALPIEATAIGNIKSQMEVDEK